MYEGECKNDIRHGHGKERKHSLPEMNTKENSRMVCVMEPVNTLGPVAICTRGSGRMANNGTGKFSHHNGCVCNMAQAR